MSSFWEMYVFVPPQQPLADVVLAAVGAAYCILGIWAGRSRRQWFVRGVAVLAALTLFALIEAYEPMVLFALTIGLLVTGELAAGKRTRSQTRVDGETKTSPPTSPRWQFQLHDLLLATVVVGVALWLGLRAFDHGLAIRHWWKPPLAAFQLALVSSTAVGVLHARRRWLAMAFLAVFLFAAAMNELLIVGDWLGLESGAFRVLSDHLLAYAVFAALCGAFWTAADASSWQPSRSLTSRAGTTAAAVLCAAAVLLLGWIYWQMLDYGSDPPPIATGPNSLPRVLALAEELQLAKATPAKAQPIYDELLVRLAEPGYVKVDWEQVQQDGGFEVGQFGLYRQLARDLKAEAARLASAGESDRAAAMGVACTQLGDRLTTDSGAVYGLVGWALVSMGQSEISKLRHDLPAATRQNVLRQLQTLQSESYEPFEQIWLEETKIAQLFGWTYRFDVLVNQDLWSGQDRQSREQLKKAYLRHQVPTNLLLVELAILCYRDDHGAWPDRLDELVPDYLPQVPLDPLSGTPLVYRVTGDDYLLYSVGTDRQDNGGKFGDATAVNNAWFAPEPGLDFDLNGLWK
jgi:hypothetical protein